MRRGCAPSQVCVERSLEIPEGAAGENLFGEHPQSQLQADAPQGIAGIVAKHDALVVAIIEQLARAFEGFPFGRVYFGSRAVSIPPFLDRDRGPVIVGYSVGHPCIPLTKQVFTLPEPDMLGAAGRKTCQCERNIGPWNMPAA